MERHFLIRNCRVIVGEADISDIQSLSSVKALEIIVAETSRNLSCSVRSEIEKDHGIAVFDRCNGSAVLHHNGRFYKFVRFLPVIGSLNPFRRARRLKAFSLCQRSIGFLHSVIVVISVHRIVTARYGSDFADADLLHLRFQIFHEPFSARRRRIASVQESMHINFFQTVSSGKFQQTVQMCIVAVYAAVRYQSVHMKRRIVLLAVIYGIQQSRILKKSTVLNFFRNSGQFLIYDAARAHIQMSDLGISHLAVRKACRHTACISLHKGTFLHQFVHNGRIGLRHRIPLCLSVQAVAV